MPRMPRITAREAERAIMSDGWYRIGSKGSHVQHKHATKAGRVTLHFHVGEILKPKTLQTVIAQAGLAVEQFSKLL